MVEVETNFNYLQMKKFTSFVDWLEFGHWYKRELKQIEFHLQIKTRIEKKNESVENAQKQVLTRPQFSENNKNQNTKV